MNIRPPHADDHALLSTLLDESGVFRADEIEVAKELLESSIARALGRPDADDYEALVAAEPASDRPVGWLCFGRTPMTEATFDLYWIVVDQSRRGAGIGGRLMDAFERELLGRGAVNIRIETSSLEGQGGAKRFYATRGYEQVGLLRDFYRSGDDLLTFSKRLAP